MWKSLCVCVCVSVCVSMCVRSYVCQNISSAFYCRDNSLYVSFVETFS